MKKNEEERGNEKTRKKCARESLIRSSGGLSPSSCTLLGEYRLSVVRLGVLHSSKYLGIFEESRVPKKTVYSVRRRDPSGSPNAPGLEQSSPASFVDNQTCQHRACRKKIYKGKIYGVYFIRNITAPMFVFRIYSTARTPASIIISILIPVIRTKCTTNCSLYHVA